MKNRSLQSGVTLLEMMVVLAIIALVAGLAAPRLMDGFGRAKSRTAGIQMESLRSSVQLFYLDTGRYPSEGEGLRALVTSPQGVSNWHGPYLNSGNDLQDPWGRDYIYRYPGIHRTFDLLSYGRDGRPGGTSEDSDLSL